MTTGKVQRENVPVSSSSSSGGSGRRSPGLTSPAYADRGGQNVSCTSRVVVEQREEHDDALRDRRAQAVVEASPAVRVPTVDRLQLVASRSSHAVLFVLAHSKRHLSSLRGTSPGPRSYGCANSPAVLGKPQSSTGPLHAVFVVVARGHDDDFWRVLQRRLSSC